MRTMKTAVGLAATVMVVCGLAFGQETRPAGDGGKVPWSKWVSVGPGGGGHQRLPVISPHDPSLMFVGCDMSGFYRSTDAGRTWRMDVDVHSITSPAIFHPTNPNIVYVFDLFGGELKHGWRFLRSDDKGQTWKVLRSELGGYDVNMGMDLALDPEQANYMVAGFAGSQGAEVPGKIMTSKDGGVTWVAAPGDIPVKANVFGLVLDRASDKANRTFYAGTSEGVYVSTDNGQHWKMAPAQPGDGKIARFTSCQDTSGKLVMLAIANSVAAGEFFPGGQSLYKSADRGKTWEKLTDKVLASVKTKYSGPRFRAIALSNANPQLMWTSLQFEEQAESWQGEYKSTDGGATWQLAMPNDKDRPLVFGPQRTVGSSINEGWLTRDPAFSWGFGDMATYIAMSQTNPDILLRTDDARTIGTFDGGKSWQQLYTDEVKDNFWASRGMEVCNTHELYFDPKDHNKVYIAYTDINSFRSENRGKSWTFCGRGMPCRNTVYEMAIDPDQPNIIYAANTDNHDLPEFKMLRQDLRKFRGGIAKTTDSGVSWTTVGARGGLPQGCPTSILIDPSSPKEKRTLLACVIGYGVYRSTDGGENWTLSDKGMDYLKVNPNVWRLTMGKGGEIYASITKKITIAGGKRTCVGGALYRSDDHGQSWTRIGPTMPASGLGTNDFAQLWDVCASKTEADTVYVGTFEDHMCGGDVDGHIWVSHDKGKTWKTIFDNEAISRISLHPSNPKIIFAGTFFDGLFVSADGGATFQHAKGLPFKSVKKVTVDPDDPGTIWVATYGGGVWRGPALGE